MDVQFGFFPGENFIVVQGKVLLIRNYKSLRLRTNTLVYESDNHVFSNSTISYKKTGYISASCFYNMLYIIFLREGSRRPSW